MHKIRYWEKIYFYSILLGLRSILKSPFNLKKEPIKRILIPMDIARCFEIPYCYKYLDPHASERILDMSSPKLLSLFVSEHDHSKVTATDIFSDEIKSWQSLVKSTFFNSELKKNLVLKVADGKKLSFKTHYFDKAYSISVIEHMGKTGDSRAIKELARVLKPGGRLVITVPFGLNYHEIWLNKKMYSKKTGANKTFFFCRVYDKKSLEERLVKASGLLLEKKVICREEHPFWTQMYAKLLPVSGMFGLLFPIIALLSLRIGSKIDQKNNILLVLRKRD